MRAAEGKQLLGAKPLQETAITGEHHSEQDVAVEPGRRQQAQLGEHGGRHLLGLVDDQHGARQRGVDMGLPAVAQNLGAGPSVVRGQLDAEQIAHLAIEVGEAGLGSRDDADPCVTLVAEALGEDAQGDGLARTGHAGDEGEAALADELLDAPAERLDAARDVQRLDRHVGGEGVPLEAVKREHLLVHEPSPSSSLVSCLGR
jgi:hypothetical protein